MSAQRLQKLGEITYNKVDKINAELLTMTYGSLVSQLLKDYEDPEEVNTQLEKMGYKMGIRMIDEFMSKSNMDPCENFRETAETIAKVGLRMFLGITAHVINFVDHTHQSTTTTGGGGSGAGQQSFSLVFDENPLNDFVELPDAYRDTLYYSNIICGAIRGCLEIMQMKVETHFVRCQLRGDNTNEIQVTLVEVLAPSIPDDED